MNGSLSLCLFGIAAMVALGPAPGSAEPARIIILRHAEKLNHKSLCDLGEQRAQALARQFLGRDATQSLFAAGGEPAAFLAITHHTIETITPSAQSWNVPVSIYRVEILCRRGRRGDTVSVYPHHQGIGEPDDGQSNQSTRRNAC